MILVEFHWYLLLGLVRREYTNLNLAASLQRLVAIAFVFFKKNRHNVLLISLGVFFILSCILIWVPYFVDCSYFLKWLRKLKLV